MNRPHLIITVLVLIVLGFGIQAFVNYDKQPANEPIQTNDQISPSPTPPNQASEPKLAAPIDKADQRVTKKPVGIFITKANSPVSPERFYGYHTGTDFETFSEEANVFVPVYAICEGKIKKTNCIRLWRVDSTILYNRRSAGDCGLRTCQPEEYRQERRR